MVVEFDKFCYQTNQNISSIRDHLMLLLVYVFVMKIDIIFHVSPPPHFFFLARLKLLFEVEIGNLKIL